MLHVTVHSAPVCSFQKCHVTVYKCSSLVVCSGVPVSLHRISSSAQIHFEYLETSNMLRAQLNCNWIVTFITFTHRSHIHTHTYTSFIQMSCIFSIFLFVFFFLFTVKYSRISRCTCTFHLFFMFLFDFFPVPFVLTTRIFDGLFFPLHAITCMIQHILHEQMSCIFTCNEIGEKKGISLIQSINFDTYTHMLSYVWTNFTWFTL